MEITASMVKDLRGRTGAGMMDCKTALAETEGDLDKAVDVLRTKGLADLAKKAGRATNEGVVGGVVSDDARIGALVEVNCETDFVALNDDFKAFVAEIAAHVLAAAPADLDALMGQQFAGKDQTVEEALGETVGRIGENMGIARFERFELTGEGIVAVYIHGVGRVGVMVELAAPGTGADAAGSLVTLAKDVAMQVAAAAPLAVRREEMPQDVVEHEKGIYAAQAADSGKPEEIQEKIAQGRLGKFFKEVCLLEQAFVKDPDISVGKLLEQAGADLGADVTVARFARFEIADDEGSAC